MWTNIMSVGADQLRKLAMNVEGMSLAGGTAGAPSKGTDSAIVLRVVRNRASVHWSENWNGEGKVRGAMWNFTGSQLIVRYMP
jgi:hypothetical protein